MNNVSQERFERFKESIKKFYSWELILRDAGITEVSDKGDQYEISCILHEDKRPSLRLNKVTGVYHCFSCGASGTYTKFLWELSGRSMPYMVFCDQILRSRPEVQAECGFTTLFDSEKTLAPEFEKRRRFVKTESPERVIPLPQLVSEVKKVNNSWDGLALSLTLLQSNASPRSILAFLKQNVAETKEVEEASISVMDLLEGD